MCHYITDSKFQMEFWNELRQEKKKKNKEKMFIQIKNI